MFGKSIERIAYEYLKADRYHQEPLRKELLRSNPVKSTALLVIGGAVVLKEFGLANLTTPYRNAPEAIYTKAMAFHEKVVTDVANFADDVGDEGLLQVCNALTASEERIAIFAAFVLLYRSGYSEEVMQRINYSLHHLSSSLSDRARTLLGSLILFLQAQEGDEQVEYLLQSEAMRKGLSVQDVGDAFLGEAVNYLLPYQIGPAPSSQPASTDEGYDLTAQWTHYWNWVDPDNAPWNYDN